VQSVGERFVFDGNLQWLQALTPFALRE
jgi:hypothetical protein